MNFKKEIWKPIPNYWGYMVSNLGRVKSLTREVWVKPTPRTVGHVSLRKGRMLRPGRNTKYGHVTVSLGRHNSINVHRLVLLAFKGPCPKGKEVLHKNGKAWDNRLSNLRYGTRSENNIDISKMDRRKLKVKNVIEIKTTKRKTNSVSNWAKKFKVSKSAIRRVLDNSNWKWV